MSVFKKTIVDALNRAGITINGGQPADVRVNDDTAYSRIALEGTLGMGESYVDGQWDSDDLAELINRLIRSGGDEGRRGFTGNLISLSQKFYNAQNIARSRRVGELHYDVGNDLYAKMLDPRLVYTCGYWKDAKNLAEAQEAKLDLVCRKLKLHTGQKVLDVGCGWGSFAKFAAEKYGAEVVGITISKEQLALAQELCKGLPINLRLMDYRDLPKEFPAGYFDHIVSIGMFEHVGPKNYDIYMRTLAPLLKPKGLFLLHTIGSNNEGGFDPWLERYIFPGGWIPTLDSVAKAASRVFEIEDVQNFGPDYDRTLCAWWENFDAAWPELKATGKYSDRFYRMWRYYLLLCAGAFRSRATQLYQFVLSPAGAETRYDSVR